jgi:hypothetical protein
VRVSGDRQRTKNGSKLFRKQHTSCARRRMTSHDENAVNRPDFSGGSNMREDGAYGNSKAVFNGSTGAGCAAGAGAAG